MMRETRNKSALCELTLLSFDTYIPREQWFTGRVFGEKKNNVYYSVSHELSMDSKLSHFRNIIALTSP